MGNNPSRTVSIQDTFTAPNIRRCEKYVLNMQKRLDEAVANNDKKMILIIGEREKQRCCMKK